MAFNCKSNCFANFLFAFFILCSVTSVIDSGSSGIIVKLIHRDSPLSPFYNPNETRFDRMQNALRRSHARASSFNPASISTTDSETFEAPVSSNNGEFLMEISVGSPPVAIQAIADTGSSLIWTKCAPKEKASFDPSKSSTYRELPCSSIPCGGETFDDAVTLNCESGICKYATSYNDDYKSAGKLATETFILQSNSGESKPFPSVLFGCEQGNSENTTKPSGIIGLGGGEYSMVNQLYKSFQKIFSYCLSAKDDASGLSAKDDASGKLSFGSNALVSGPNVVSTPLSIVSTHYHLRLEGVTVGSKRFDYNSGSHGGNIIIDSGTAYTFLPGVIYQQVESELKQVIKAELSTTNPEGFKLCYHKTKFEAPKIVVHFTNADIELQSTSTFSEIKLGVVCLTLMPPYQNTGAVIFGYYSQVNYRVGYDLVNKKVNFMPTTDCSMSP